MTPGVRPVEILLICVILTCWALAVVTFLHKWQKLRLSYVSRDSRDYSRRKPRNLDAVQVVGTASDSVISCGYSKTIVRTMEQRQLRLDRLHTTTDAAASHSSIAADAEMPSDPCMARHQFMSSPSVMPDPVHAVHDSVRAVHSSPHEHAVMAESLTSSHDTYERHPGRTTPSMCTTDDVTLSPREYPGRDPLRLISLFVMSSVKPVRSVHGEESMLVFKAIWTAFTILPLYGALSQYGAVQRVFHCDLIRFYTGFMGILYNLH